MLRFCRQLRSMMMMGLLFLWMSSAWAAPAAIRGWELPETRPEVALAMVDRAPRYGINYLELTEGAWNYIDFLSTSTARRDLCRRIVERAHAHGIRVFLWAREFPRPPSGSRMCLDPRSEDGKRLWEARREAYRKGFEAVPGLDGVTLHFGSAAVEPWEVDCPCDFCRGLSPVERAKLTLEQIVPTIRAAGKEIVFRDFIHSPQQMGWMRDLFRQSPRPFTVSSKCEPQDWQPWYPHNPLIGDAGGRRQIIEFDLAGEYCGVTQLPFCAPRYLQERLRYDFAHGATGAVGRPSIYERYAFDTPNEVNVYAFSRLLQDVETPVEKIWADWVKERYGLAPDSPASRAVIRALQRTFDIARKMYYVRGFWLVKSSDLPATLSAPLPPLLLSRSTARYDTRYLPLQRELEAPTARTITDLIQEKREATELCDQSLADLARARGALKASDYQDLERRLRHQRSCTQVWERAWAAVFRLMLYNRQGGDTDRALAMGDVEALQRLADGIEREFGAAAFPGNPATIRSFAASVAGHFPASYWRVPPQERSQMRLTQIRFEPYGTDRVRVSWLTDRAADGTVLIGSERFALAPGPRSPRQEKAHSLIIARPAAGKPLWCRVRSRAQDGEVVTSGDWEVPRANAVGLKG